MRKNKMRSVRSLPIAAAFLSLIVAVMGLVSSVLAQQLEPPTGGASDCHCSAVQVVCVTPEEIPNYCNNNPNANGCLKDTPDANGLCIYYTKTVGPHCGNTYPISSPPVPSADPSAPGAPDEVKKVCSISFPFGANEPACDAPHCEKNSKGYQKQVQCLQNYLNDCLQNQTPENILNCNKIAQMACTFSGYQKLNECRCEIGSPSFGMPCAECVQPCKDVIKSCLMGLGKSESDAEKTAVAHCGLLACSICESVPGSCTTCEPENKQIALLSSGEMCEHCLDKGKESASIEVKACTFAVNPANGQCQTTCSAPSTAALSSNGAGLYTVGGAAASSSSSWLAFSPDSSPVWKVNDYVSFEMAAPSAMCGACKVTEEFGCSSYKRKYKCPSDASASTSVSISISKAGAVQQVAKPGKRTLQPAAQKNGSAALD